MCPVVPRDLGEIPFEDKNNFKMKKETGINSALFSLFLSRSAAGLGYIRLFSPIAKKHQQVAQSCVFVNPPE
jgi:hypothetical protein